MLGHGGQPERLRRRRSRACTRQSGSARGGARLNVAASEAYGDSPPIRLTSGTKLPWDRHLRRWHGPCYKYSFVWAGVAQSGRAADL